MQAHLRAIAVTILLGSILTVAGIGQAETTDKAYNDTLLRIELCRKMTSWLQQGNANDAAECDRLIDKFLAMEKRTVPGYLAVAQAANLRGRTDQAISVLESLIAKYPDENAYVANVPVKVLATFWVATYAKQAGDIPRAVQAYEAVVQNANTLSEKRRATFCALVKLYLAELDVRHFKNSPKALARLDTIEWGEGDITQERGPRDFLKRLVAYEHAALTSRSKAVAQWPDVDSMTRAPICAANLLLLVGLVGTPLTDSGGRESNVVSEAVVKRTIEGGVSRIDTSLVRLACACGYRYQGAIDKANEYYSALLEEDSFLSPVAGVGLHRIWKDQGKENEARELLKTLRARYSGCSRVWDEVQQSKRNQDNGQTPPTKQP